MANYYNFTDPSNPLVSTDAVSTDFQSTVTEDYFSDYDSVSTDITILPQPCEGTKAQEGSAMVVQATLFLTVLLLGMIGNGLVIATFTKYRCFRLRCMTDVFLFYLALSDLLLLLTLPLQTIEVILGRWVFGDVLCKLNNGMYAINTYGGLLLLACISVDRYLVVVRARAAQRLRPSMLRYSKLSAVLVALISVILSVPDLLYFMVRKVDGDIVNRCMMNVQAEWVKNCAKINKIAGFCIPWLTMLVCYSAIGRVLLQGQGKCWRKQRTLRLMGALVLLFLLFQLPYTVVLLIKLFVPSVDCDYWSRINLSEVITHSLAYIRCCLNPVLYALVGVRFRNDVMRLLQDCGCQCAFLKHMTPQPSGGSSVTPSSPPPTTLSPLPSANGPTKTQFANGTNPQTHDGADELSATHTTFCFSQQSKDPTYVGWGQH
ncbi:C-C chemokine receptor type 10 [Salminus brasiliensis]|uniref:C-C chemokine receptor type 10 n=1 Tax=Salminus brasiliensis TaxID=930266 RepID=UPI003B8390F9